MHLGRAALLLGLLGLGSAKQACNGDEAYCDRLYSNMTYIGAHGSPFDDTMVGGFNNQEQFVVDQLKSGVRFLQVQTQPDHNGLLATCHTTCLLGNGGPLSTFLEQVKGFLKDNPNEVVTILLTNPKKVEISKYDEAYRTSGLYEFVFKKGPKPIELDQWPTLRQMISNGTRVVTLMDYNMNETAVEYVLDLYHLMWETPYDTTDPKFPQCAIDRPQGGDDKKLMYMINHYLDHNISPLGIVTDTGSILAPDKGRAPYTNSLKSIQAQVDLCVKEHKRKPNVILLDWTSIGDAKKVYKIMNRIT